MPYSMPHRSTNVKPLLLAGGGSTRMNFPKHLLQMPDGRPVYQHQLDRLLRACPEADTIYVSLGRESVLDGFLRDVARPIFTTPWRSGARASTPGPIAIIYDREPSEIKTPEPAKGPTAGLLAAHDTDPDAAWLVLACDYPLLPDNILSSLRDSYEPPVTSVRGLNGAAEPLIAIWSPAALRELAARSREGNLPDDLESVVKNSNDLVLDPPEHLRRLMLTVKTESDWEKAYALACEAQQGREGPEFSRLN